jgi:hypothetical protein
VNPFATSTSTPPSNLRELVQRVAASPRFQKSRRLRDLLLYLAERGLRDPAEAVHEQAIGVEVFGRRVDYDTSHDTLVRVQVSQLRKKLQEYFGDEGRDEPVVIEIPKGSYTPVFRQRPEETPEVVPVTTPAWPSPAPPRPRLFLAGLILGLAAMGLAWWILGAAKQSGDRPSVTTLWRQMFGNGQAISAVISDVNLMMFENLIGRSVPIPEYETHEFDRLADLYLTQPAERAMAQELSKRVTTSLSDVQAARDFGVLSAQQKMTLNLMSARDFSSTLISSQNTILMGSLRSNPWVGLFEGQMNFQTEYQEKPAAMRFVNRSPMAGEEPYYAAEWRRTGYCRLVYLPNSRRTGSVLVISGSDVISTDAGARFVMSEEYVRLLRQKLGLARGEAFPNFEILLKTQVVNDSIPWFELVAYRPHKKN